MILGPGQRRKKEEFQNVERQFALDDVDVAQDRLLGVARKPDDVARVRDGAVLAPFPEGLGVHAKVRVEPILDSCSYCIGKILYDISTDG